MRRLLLLPLLVALTGPAVASAATPPETIPPGDASPSTSQPADTTTTTTDSTVPSTTDSTVPSTPDTTVPAKPARLVLSADRWSPVYGNVSINAIMGTIRDVAGGDYTARPDQSDRSGGYAITDATWDNYGGYQRAADAPPAVQDQFVYTRLVWLVAAADGDLRGIVDAWYPGDVDDTSFTAWLITYQEQTTIGGVPYLPANDPATPLIRQIAFPLAGPVTFYNDWQACRDACSRSHEGIDLIGTKGQPLLAAVNGTITGISPDHGTIAGASIEITDAEGWRYIYRHINNDTPGSNDGRSPLEWAFHPALHVGSVVHAGQVIAYMGNSGNAEHSVPHLHFETRLADGTSVNPYPTLLAAQQRQQCTIGIGAWSTLYDRDGDGNVTVADNQAATTPTDQPLPDSIQIIGPDGAIWQYTAAGDLWANPQAATIASHVGCPEIDPTGPTYGTGIGPLNVPDGWLAPAPPKPAAEPVRTSSHEPR